MCNYVGLKLSQDDPIARCVSVIRKIEPDLSIADINSRIKNDEYVLSYDYTDDSGVKKIIKCYEELSKYGIKPRLFELDDTECGIDILRNLAGMYDEIGDEIDAYREENLEDKKIFEYKLSNAWLFPIVSLSVYDRKEENVKCLVWLATDAPKDLQLTKKYSLEETVIKQIAKTISNYSKLFKIKEVEFPPCLDGFSNEFFFRSEKGIARIEASNIWCWAECSESIDGKKPVKAKLVLEVFSKIKDLLVENGVDNRYLSLVWGSEDD